MEQLEKFKEYAKHFKEKYGSEALEGARVFFITKTFDYAKEDFEFVTISILEEEYTIIKNHLLTYINTPSNYNELATIDYHYVQKHKTQLYKNYAICSNSLRKLNAKHVVNKFSISKEEIEIYKKELVELQEYVSKFITSINQHFQKEIKKLENPPKQNISGNMYA